MSRHRKPFFGILTGELGRNRWKAVLSCPSESESEQAERGSESGDFSGAPIHLFVKYSIV